MEYFITKSLSYLKYMYKRGDEETIIRKRNIKSV